MAKKTPGYKYRCRHCEQTVTHNLDRKYINSYCEAKGRMARLVRVADK